MRFGRALLAGVAQGGKAWMEEQERNKAQARQVALMQLQQRYNAMRDNRTLNRMALIEQYKHYARLEEDKQKAAMKAEQDAQYKNSDEYRAKMDRYRAETEYYERRSRNAQADSNKSADRESKDKWTRLNYLDKAIKGMYEKDEMGEMTLAPGMEREYQAMKAERDRLRVDLGVMPGSETANVNASNSGLRPGFDFMGRPLPAAISGQSGASEQGGLDDPLGIRGNLPVQNNFIPCGSLEVAHLTNAASVSGE